MLRTLFAFDTLFGDVAIPVLHLVPYSVMLRTLFAFAKISLLAPFWLPFGSLLDPVGSPWLPLAPFWLSLAPFWLPLAPFWLPLAPLMVQNGAERGPK